MLPWKRSQNRNGATLSEPVTNVSMRRNMLERDGGAFWFDLEAKSNWNSGLGAETVKGFQLFGWVSNIDSVSNRLPRTRISSPSRGGG